MKPSQVIAVEGIESILARLAAGEQQTTIADSLGIGDDILSYHLRKHPQHRLAVISHHRRKLDELDKLADGAIDARDFDLARALELAHKRKAWRASVEARECFAQNAEVSVTVNEPERDITQVARRLAFLLAKGIDAGEVVAEVVTIDQTPSIESDTPK